MNDEMKLKLYKTIGDKMEVLDSLEPGTDEHVKATEDLVKLIKLVQDDDRLVMEGDEKYNRRCMDRNKITEEIRMKEDQFNREMELKEREMDFKESQQAFDETIRDRETIVKEEQNDWHWKETLITIGVPAAISLLGYGCYNGWFKKGLKFQETGTYTTPEIRNLLSSMLPKLRK